MATLDYFAFGWNLTEPFLKKKCTLLINKKTRHMTVRPVKKGLINKFLQS